MEYIEAIFYHRILESDFTNMYTTKKPHGGNGQTFVQAAGYSREALDRIFGYAKRSVDTPEFWDSQNRYPRKRYIVDAFVVGGTEVQEIELAPRTGRVDYRIPRQNVSHRHPAWRVSNGFPAPEYITTEKGIQYIYEKNYPGKIDNLYILILLTRSDSGEHKYYADYVKSPDVPDEWPHGIGLEAIFTGPKKKGGIIFFNDEFIRFTNIKGAPFAAGSGADKDIGSGVLPNEINETSEDAVEYATKEIKQFDTDIVNVKFTSVPIPVAPRKSKRASAKGTSSSYIRTGKKVNYVVRQKNLKKIGDFGEKLAIEIEKRRLHEEGRDDLAAQVEHVSATLGDGLGYDIKSFERSEDGNYHVKYIEVKATTGGKSKPFDISENEVQVSTELGNQYSIYRFFGLHNQISEVKFYEIHGAITDNFDLKPATYKAFLK